ncbi:hypothetical protein GIB67_019097 [Kingdonia uniflora]|uniref:BHLH domain-containing protein n=1 Tax=Kingdonia uniflora TaxID=39325 RepID=A0A7J7N063_9MAGN|nr:hypothetical protein GIB67_019097 [Kingdonia uniflora]
MKMSGSIQEGDISTTTSSSLSFPAYSSSLHKSFQENPIKCSDNNLPSLTDKHNSTNSSSVVEFGEQVTQMKKITMEKQVKKRDVCSTQSKDPKTSISKKQRKTSPSMKETEENQKGVFEEPPKDYVHVKARRGEATDSHSLAERVKRERISERLKMLQGLVPGCDKVLSKALIEPEETKEPEEGDIIAAEYTGGKSGGVTDCQTPAAGDQWSSEVAAGNWGSEAPPPIAAVLVANEPEWTAADQGPRPKVTKKESLIDIVTREEVEPEIVLKELGINKNKRANSSSEKVQKSQAKRPMTGVGASKKRGVDREKRSVLSRAYDIDFEDVPKVTTSCKLALKFLKKKIGKHGLTSGTMGSGEVERDTKKRGVNPPVEVIGAKVVESRPTEEDEL